MTEIGYFKRLPEKQYIYISDIVTDLTGVNPEEILDKHDHETPWSLLADTHAKIDFELRTGRFICEMTFVRTFNPLTNSWTASHSQSFYKEGLIQGAVTDVTDLTLNKWPNKLCHITQTLPVSKDIILSRRDLKLLRAYILRTPMKTISHALHLSVKGIEKAFARIKGQYETSLNTHMNTPQLMVHLNECGLTEFLLARDDWFDYAPSIRRINV